MITKGAESGERKCPRDGRGRFIGSNLVDELLERGWSVTVLDDLSLGHAETLSPREVLSLVVGAVLDRAAVDAAERGYEVVFHLAASVGNKKLIDDPGRDAWAREAACDGLIAFPSWVLAQAPV